MPNLSTSDFKLAKSVFLAKDDASTAVAFFKSIQLLKILVLENIPSFILYLFYLSKY